MIGDGFIAKGYHTHQRVAQIICAHRDGVGVIYGFGFNKFEEGPEKCVQLRFSTQIVFYADHLALKCLRPCSAANKTQKRSRVKGKNDAFMKSTVVAGQ
jgi:hypothetical protein